MSAFLQRNWPLAAILCAALWLRTHDLARRPMHADEANQAVKTGLLLESGDYAFDPRDHHGPVLYYATLPLAWLRGQHTLATLDEVTVRLVPALAGLAVVLGVAWLAAPWGRWPAAAAAAFTALSPPAVYYSRYYVHETLLAAGLLATILCARQWLRSSRVGWAAAAGLCAGLAQTAKASTPLFLFVALAAAAWSARGAPSDVKPAHRARLAAALALALGAGAIVALFYTSFGRHPAGLADALDTYRLTAARLAGGGTGHEKPWWYYASLFGWRRAGGLVFEQLAFAALALAGAALAARSRDPLARWTLAFTLGVAVLLSVPAYKTPWHAIHLVPGLALLAAHALAAIRFRAVALSAAALVLMLQARQVGRVAFTRAADPRNPYAYAHSSPDVRKFFPLATAALARDAMRPVRVIGEEYWPLPWYLRSLPRVGYWSEPPETCDGALVIASAAQAPAVRARLRGDYRESLLGLRPGVLCVVFTPRP